MQDKAKKIINDITYVTLATVNDDGTPWNTPVYFATDGRHNFYWSSHPQSRHSQNILRDGKVFAVIYDSTSQDGEGVYLQCEASVVDDESEVARALELLGSRRGKPFKDISKFMSPGPQRIFKAVPLQTWMNDADQDQDGDFIRDYRVEIEV